MERTKIQGVYQHDAKDGTRTYYIQYKHNGKNIRQKIGTKAEGITPTYCKKIREQTLVRLRLGEHAPIKSRTTTKTLDVIAKEYFKDSEARSIKKLQSVYNTHIAHLGSELITSIDVEAIEKLRKKKTIQKSPKTGRPLALKTVRNILAVLSAILGFALKKKYIKELPEIQDEIKKTKTDNTRTRFLSKDEIDLLLDTIEKKKHGKPKLLTADRLLMFVKVSLFTGARLGSVLTIKGKDIKRKENTITIQNHKSNRSYTSFVPTSLMDEIPTLDHNQLLIDVSDPKQIQRPLQAILNELFNEELEADERKERVVIHTLRHTFASHLAIAGTPIQTIMKLMDHSDLTMTLKYAKLTEDAGKGKVIGLYQ